MDEKDRIIITGPSECAVCHDRANHIAPGGAWYCDEHYLPVLEKIVGKSNSPALEHGNNLKKPSWEDKLEAVPTNIQYTKNHDGTQTAIMRQPKPKGTGTPINDLVIADLQARKKYGIKKYGEPLKAHNGRDALVDAYQEALDLTVYLKQQLEEDKEILVVLELLQQMVNYAPFGGVGGEYSRCLFCTGVSKDEDSEIEHMEWCAYMKADAYLERRNER